MPPELQQLFQDLDVETLRFRRPNKFIFFCGGAMRDERRAAFSLRHFLLQDRRIEPRLNASVVLAEGANQLYRDSDYDDLITFEEDIAKISALVLVIAESPGSLAELGAFSAIDSIRSKLAVLIQSEHEVANSFVRYGPLEKIRKEDDRRLAALPWSINRSGKVIKKSASPHVLEVIKFINDLIEAVPNEEKWRAAHDMQHFILILWILHLANAMKISDIIDYASSLMPCITNKSLKNLLFSMKVAGWVNKFRYSNVEYWYSTSSKDPISRYSFVAGVLRDTARRKTEVATAIKTELKLPSHVRNRVLVQKGNPA